MRVSDAFEFEVVGPITSEDIAELPAAVELEWEAFRREQDMPASGIGTLVKKFADQLTRKQEASAAPAPTNTDTTSGLSRVRNPSGIVASLDNAVMAVRKLGVVFRYDEFRQKVICEGVEGRLGVTMDDIVLHVRRAVIQALGFDPEPTYTRDAIRLLAQENSFNPVLDWIEAQPWDGVSRIDTWLSVYMGAEDNELNRAFGRAVLIAGVRRARRPGCKFDYVLVLEGPQGRGKSTALKIMAGGEDFFSDEIAIGVSYKEQQELLQGRWIVELPELAGLSRAEVSRVKQFITKTHDRARGAFERSVKEMPRGCIFIGTTNDAQYLRDTTGNRRWWPVAVGKIDLKGLEADMPQLWAEAAEAERDAPDPISIPQGLWAAAAERQAERVTGDPWEDVLLSALPALSKVVEGELRISTVTVFEKIMGLEMRHARMGDYRRLGDCMRKLGWSGPKVLRINGANVKGYWKAPLKVSG
ncbi:VapE domain-containing protein [Mesorhizobium sp. WSM4310]|uniref:VapE domain-containing protein n=1 Tax=Mesorhizobium sp. WSM4310 TaxID=2589883 RepID=UPI001FEDB358|nr:VapE domain-containing protein [Mesorhizobium sp. WSM4310]